MSDNSAGEEMGGWDALAGEYVLGLLNHAAARSVEQRALSEPALARTIADWQSRLDPLADLAAPVPPSGLLWQRIAADLPPTNTGAGPRAGNPWRAASLALMALAAALGFLILYSHARPGAAPLPRAVALLAAPGSARAALRAQVTGAGTITVVPLMKLTVPDGAQLGFWAWPVGEPAPVLIGMIAPAGGQMSFPFPPREGTPVMVTLEHGGRRPATPGRTLYLGFLVAGPA